MSSLAPTESHGGLRRRGSVESIISYAPTPRPFHTLKRSLSTGPNGVLPTQQQQQQQQPYTKNLSLIKTKAYPHSPLIIKYNEPNLLELPESTLDFARSLYSFIQKKVKPFRKERRTPTLPFEIIVSIFWFMDRRSLELLRCVSHTFRIAADTTLFQRYRRAKALVSFTIPGGIGECSLQMFLSSVNSQLGTFVFLPRAVSDASQSPRTPAVIGSSIKDYEGPTVQSPSVAAMRAFGLEPSLRTFPRLMSFALNGRSTELPQWQVESGGWYAGFVRTEPVAEVVERGLPAEGIRCKILDSKGGQWCLRYTLRPVPDPDAQPTKADDVGIGPSRPRIYQTSRSGPPKVPRLGVELCIESFEITIGAAVALVHGPAPKSFPRAGGSFFAAHWRAFEAQLARNGSIRPHVAAALWKDALQLKRIANEPNSAQALVLHQWLVRHLDECDVSPDSVDTLFEAIKAMRISMVTHIL
ncbi:uncharacterized protein BJ171DRAFT_489384 [Polychytrium aggregatum]|uniref:uncharacterized protein n=1 Tax=Polychytrium aggregatum TaxID=110093 RepID=UPI0022FDD38A|nr:uncharacterized protein BJ171DRAFT_489384 [Polychytrium aggregatum]KAI9208571.1 hypothetical protein BJ171DRAFT_489384 [Polychytrium aggregatum]